MQISTEDLVRFLRYSRYYFYHQREQSLTVIGCVFRIHYFDVAASMKQKIWTTVRRHLCPRLTGTDFAIARMVLAVYAVAFFVVYPFACRRLAFSWYLAGDAPTLLRRAVNANDVRLAAARAFLEQASAIVGGNSTNDGVYRSIEGRRQRPIVDVVVAVVTIGRNIASKYEVRAQMAEIGLRADAVHLGYLTQTVARLRRIDEAPGFERKAIVVCDVDDLAARRRTNVEVAELAPHVDAVVHKYGDDDEGRRVTSVDGNSSLSGGRRAITDDVWNKEKDDYAFCLEAATRLFDARYVLLMEDDVLLEDRAFVVVSHAVRWRIAERRSAAHGDVTSPPIDDEGGDHIKTDDDVVQRRRRPSWLFIKLYYHERWQGYAFEFESIVELIAFATVGGSLSTVVYAHFVAAWWRLNQRRFVIFVGGAVFAVLSAEVVGRPHVQSWRSVSPLTHRLVAPAPDSCTQAMLYPTAVVADLVAFLRRVRCTRKYAVDLAIARYVRLGAWPSYRVEPNICRHVGFVSAVKSEEKLAAEFIF